MLVPNNPFQPRFVHDCATCVFTGQDGAHDMYFCAIDGECGGSVIARYGAEGEYASSSVAGTLTLDLRPAERGPDSATGTYIKLARHLVREGYVNITVDQNMVEKRRNNEDG